MRCDGWTYAHPESAAKKVLDAVPGGAYPVTGVRCEAHRGDAREPGRHTRTGPPAAERTPVEADGDRSGNEPSGAPVRVKHDGRVGKRSVAAVPAAPAEAEASTDRVYERVQRSRAKARGSGQAPEYGSLSRSQSERPAQRVSPGQPLPPRPSLEDGRGIRFGHLRGATHPPPRGSAVCVSHPVKRPARPGSGLHHRRLSCRGSPSAQTAAGLTGASARACATTKVCHG